VDELVAMLDQMMAWKPDYALSIHSDVGSLSVPEHVYPLINQEADRAWAVAMSKVAQAKLPGWGVQAPKVRTDLAWQHRTVKLGVNKAVLLEMGDHNVVPHALFNWTYAEYVGYCSMYAFLKACGILVKDLGPPAGMKVPMGGSPVVLVLPLVKYEPGVPYMRDNMDNPDIYIAPIHWLQRKLNSLYKAGTIIKRRDGSTRKFPLDTDGIFGMSSEGAVKLFQSTHKDLTGVPLEVDGIVGPKTWGALQAA
jgi:hypothetical protein